MKRTSSKGQAEMLEWFPRLIMLLVAVVIIAMLVRYFAEREVDASEIDRASELYRIYYDGNLITYTSASGRAYPGIIDFAKFTSDVLDTKLGTTQDLGSSDISAQLILSGCKEATIWHNVKGYKQYISFASAGVQGPGSATMEETLLPVTIYDAGTRCPGTLNITIVRPNS